MEDESIVSHLDAVAESLTGKPASPAFPERYMVTRALMSCGDRPRIRSLAAPYYVTDLGVRRFRDPSEFYRAHLKYAQIDAIDLDKLLFVGLGLDVEGLASFIDASVLFFGAYETLARVVEERFDEIVESSLYDLQIYAGHVVSSVDCSSAITLFEAASRSGDSLSERYGAEHRAAAVEVKRLKAPKAGLERLFRAERDYVDGAVDGKLNSALAANLSALASLQLDGETGAYDFLKAAEGRVATLLRNGPDPVGREARSRAGRYRSQVAINEAQLHVFAGGHQDAVDRLEVNLGDAFEGAFEYLSEAQGELAYAKVLAGDYGGAISAGVEAFWRAQAIGAIGSVRAAREILVTALVRLGKVDVADSLVGLMERDVLGIYGLVPGVYGW